MPAAILQLSDFGETAVLIKEAVASRTRELAVQANRICMLWVVPMYKVCLYNTPNFYKDRAFGPGVMKARGYAGLKKT